MKLLVIDDNEDDFVLLRERLDQLDQFEFDLLQEADPLAAVDRVRTEAPDVVLLDYRLGPTDGVAVLKQMREAGLLQPVIVLTGQGDEYIAAEITRAGADAYLMKDDPDNDRLARALGSALARAGEAGAEQADRSETLTKLQTLTPREREVLDEIVAGLTNRQIAAKMHRSVETIKVHRAHIMSKVQADSTADLVRRVVTARLG